MTTSIDQPTHTPDARLERAFALVAEPGVTVLSLDVFDTCLFRRVPDPEDAFPLVARRLAERGSLVESINPVAFKRLRMAAEARARGARREAGAGVEITLPEVYAQVPSRIFFDASNEELAAVEVEVERELLVPDLDVLELVRFARERGKRVVGVSDTYFSELELRAFLYPNFNGDAELDAVFASSEHGQGKGDRLFDIVLGELGVEPREVVHVGDNKEADVESPRSRGIRAVWFERRPEGLARVLERERLYLGSEDLGPQGDAGLTAMRGKVLHRRELAELPEELRPFWRYGAIALGPAMAAFAEWVHDQTRLAGRDRAFCLMREGALLSELVNTAHEYLESDVTAEPIWLSRQVCARAGIFEGRADELRALVSRRRPPLVRDLCATVGVDVSASPALAALADTRMGEAAVVDEVLEELSSNPEARGEMVARSKLLRERVLELVRRAAADGESLVLVDLGWGGTIQKSLQDILDGSVVDLRTVGLYLVTDPRATERLLDGIELTGFLATQGVPSEATRTVMRSPEILEQACMPDVGSQIDLDADLEPVLDVAVDRDRVQSAERAAVQKGIRAFQREWARYAQMDGGHARLTAEELRPQLLAQVARATVAPTAAEAHAFGRWVHDENFGSAGFEPIVGGGHVRRALRHMDPETLMELPMSEIYWPFGLAALEDEHLAQAAEAVAMGLVSADAFYSSLEAGDLEVYFDNGYGFGEDWVVRVEGRRNRYGLSYARATLRGDEVRALRVDPVQSQCLLRVDWIALTCWVRGEAEPRKIVFDTHEALSRFRMRELIPAGAKFYMVGRKEPWMELDLRAELGGAAAYEVLVEVAYAVMLVDPRGEDAAQARELQRRAEQRSRAAKRLVRQVEHRTGVQVGQPLRKAWRKLAARLRS